MRKVLHICLTLSTLLTLGSAVAQTTLALIKPDATKRNLTSAIIKQITSNGFTILKQKTTTLPKALAEKFYAEHTGKPFFAFMIKQITSGPSVFLVLAKIDAVAAWRKLMGATNPAQAAPGTLRHLYGINIEKNSVHGSDSQLSAEREISLIFGS